MQKTKKTILLIFLLIVIIIIDSFLAFDIFFKDKSVSIKEVIENITEKEDSFDWQYYEDINEDYVGQIVFDSGLINKPVVQATSCYKSDGTPYRFFNKDGSIATDIDNYTGNDVYIWMDFETMEYDYDNKGGSIFMDYRNVLSDQNLIIYGHYFSTLYDKDVERVKAFTPLEKLLDESNYKKNSKVKLILENNLWNINIQ